MTRGVRSRPHRWATHGVSDSLNGEAGLLSGPMSPPGGAGLRAVTPGRLVAVIGKTSGRAPVKRLASNLGNLSTNAFRLDFLTIG